MADESIQHSITITIANKQQVPVYLHDSKFYLSLSNDENDGISVPSHCFLQDLHLRSNFDFYSLLHTLRFWISNTVPIALVAYMFQHYTEVRDEVLSEFENDLPFITTLLAITDAPPYARMRLAIACGMLPAVKYLYNQDYALPSIGCEVAACQGHLDCLQYLYEKGCSWDFFTCFGAVMNGNLECLQYALENGCSTVLEHQMERRYSHLQSDHADLQDPPCRFFIARADKKSEYFACLKFGIARGLPWNVLYCHQRRKFDEPEILQFMHENRCTKALPSATKLAQYGLLNCIKYAHQQGWPWDSDTCSAAAKGGHLTCLTYVHEHGCQWNTDTTSAAAAHGHLDCLQYAHTHGCPLSSDLCTDAAMNGHLQCLMYAQAAGCECDATTAYWAAANGHLGCLRHLHELGCEWNWIVTDAAATYGHTECLVYAVEHQCPARAYAMSVYYKAVSKQNVSTGDSSQLLHAVCWLDVGAPS